MSPAFDRVRRYLEQKDVRHHVHPQLPMINASFDGTHSACHVAMLVDERLFQVIAKPLFTVPEGARNQIADLCARMNYGLKLGKWELDFDGGEIRFQTATCLIDDQDLTDGMIGLVLGATMKSFDRYVPAILSCIYGNESPEDAVRRVEQ